jgi:hypothetical protein
MGDLLYLSSILRQMKEDSPELRIHVAAGRGLWADAIRHVPWIEEVIPIDSWNEVKRIGGEAGYDTVRLARVSEWMPYRKYRGWTLRARLSGRHLIDVHARVLGVRLRPEHRRPVYVFADDDPDDDPGPARALGRYALVAFHGFTNADHNDEIRDLLLRPLLARAEARGLRLAVTGPPEPTAMPAGVVDLRGAPIRKVATYVREAALVVPILNGIAVLADALERPILLVAVGNDPVEVVGPVHTAPIATLGRPGREGARGVDLERLCGVVEDALR